MESARDKIININKSKENYEDPYNLYINKTSYDLIVFIFNKIYTFHKKIISKRCSFFDKIDSHRAINIYNFKHKEHHLDVIIKYLYDGDAKNIFSSDAIIEYFKICNFFSIYLEQDLFRIICLKYEQTILIKRNINFAFYCNNFFNFFNFYGDNKFIKYMSLKNENINYIKKNNESEEFAKIIFSKIISLINFDYLNNNIRYLYLSDCFSDVDNNITNNILELKRVVSKCLNGLTNTLHIFEIKIYNDMFFSIIEKISSGLINKEKKLYPT